MNSFKKLSVGIFGKNFGKILQKKSEEIPGNFLKASWKVSKEINAGFFKGIHSRFF